MRTVDDVDVADEAAHAGVRALDLGERVTADLEVVLVQRGHRGAREEGAADQVPIPLVRLPLLRRERAVGDRQLELLGVRGRGRGGLYRLYHRHRGLPIAGSDRSAVQMRRQPPQPAGLRRGPPSAPGHLARATGHQMASTWGFDPLYE